MANRVLIVEDDESNRDVMRLVLENAGFEVSTAGTGAEAVERASAERPDTVLLDLWLPDQPGQAVSAAIRERVTPAPRIIITSGTLVDGEDAVTLGADAVLRKPFGPDLLIAALA
jgi:two-component system, OmpR family, response regulator